jgi:predicted PhzF superfamily epimerase YddE/YHI9
LAGQWPGADVVQTGHTAFYTFVALSSASLVRAYEPDLAAVAASGTPALLLTAAGEPASDTDYVLRVFGPNVGIPEDPGTGSAHCTAGPYWSGVLGRSTLVAQQLSSRGSVFRVRVDAERVRIAGHATTVLTGHLC